MPKASVAECWEKWSVSLLKPELLRALEEGARECEVELPCYVAEVLESFAASRRLEHVKPDQQTNLAGARLLGQDRDDDFPWPAEVYALSLRTPSGPTLE